MNYTTSKRCTAHVTLARGRVREYGSNRYVHLNNNQEFEIELFNPHTHSVLAKISINGKFISGGGIVLHPGQRIFLERFIDSNDKFRFSTYEVENTQESKEAISHNGDVRVEFFYEQVQPSIYLTNITTVYPNKPYCKPWEWDGRFNGRFTNCPTPDMNNCFYSSNLMQAASTNTSTFTSSVSDGSEYKNVKNFKSKGPEVTRSITPQSLETGRVEKGSRSNQEFRTVNESFNFFYSEVETLKILPLSSKPLEASDLRQYCPNCRNRIRKSSWKFCPGCGENL